MPSFAFEIRYRDIDGEEKTREEFIEDAQDREEAERFARLRVEIPISERDLASTREAPTVEILSVEEKRNE